MGPSSPTSPSAGNRRAISRPSASWIATSASVTMVPSSFNDTWARWNRSSASLPPSKARSATSRARDSVPTRSSALTSGDSRSGGRHDLVVGALPASQGGALQRVLELYHRLSVARRAVCREEGDDVHDSADDASQAVIRRVVEHEGGTVEDEEAVGDDDHAIGAGARQRRRDGGHHGKALDVGQASYQAQQGRRVLGAQRRVDVSQNQRAWSARQRAGQREPRALERRQRADWIAPACVELHGGQRPERRRALPGARKAQQPGERGARGDERVPEPSGTP